MVCRWQDGGRGGEVLQAGHGAEGEEWGSIKFGSAKFIGYGEGGRKG